MESAGIGQFIPLILIFVIFYFFLIRPQQKKVKEHKAMVESLKKGDKVVTSGGITGTISRVVDNDKVLNAEGLRNKKEFVNHKILDLAGDFLLSGYRIFGKVKCYQGGHELTNLFLRKIFKTKTSFEVIELSNFNISKKFHSKDLDKIAVNA